MNTIISPNNSAKVKENLIFHQKKAPRETLPLREGSVDYFIDVLLFTIIIFMSIFLIMMFLPSKKNIEN